MKSKWCVTRQTFIIAEPFPYEGISTRKLVLETAYYNVITAYSYEELRETVRRFPAVDCVVVHSELPNLNETGGLQELKRALTQPLVLLVPPAQESRRDSEHVVSSHDPQALLSKLREMFGDPHSRADMGRKQQA